MILVRLQRGFRGLKPLCDSLSRSDENGELRWKHQFWSELDASGSVGSCLLGIHLTYCAGSSQFDELVLAVTERGECLESMFP